MRLEECSLADWRKSRSQVWNEGLKRESKRPAAAAREEKKLGLYIDGDGGTCDKPEDILSRILKRLGNKKRGCELMIDARVKQPYWKTRDNALRFKPVWALTFLHRRASYPPPIFLPPLST